MPSTNVVVHMGLPKTGTTFLQNHVFRTCDQIADFGKTPSFKALRPEVDPALRFIASASDTKFRSRFPDLKRLLLREVQGAIASNPEASCSLLSYEGFYRPKSIHPADIYDRLQAIFGSVRVLLTVRQQFAWIRSWYLYRFHHVATGGAPSFETWAAQRRQRATWNIFQCCDYWSVVEQLLARAGADNVLVEPMERLVEAGDGGSVERLAAFLRVDARGLEAAFARAEPTKQRIDALGFLMGRVLYESAQADLSENERMLLTRVFRKMHQQLRPVQPKADVDFAVIERAFNDHELAALRRGNLLLSTHIRQDLASWGYPVDDLTAHESNPVSVSSR